MTFESKTVSDLWPMLLSVLLFIVWLVRLEGRVSGQKEWVGAIERRVDSLQTKHEALDSKTVEQLAQVRESLARIEGALGVRQS